MRAPSPRASSAASRSSAATSLTASFPVRNPTMTSAGPPPPPVTATRRGRAGRDRGRRGLAPARDRPERAFDRGDRAAVDVTDDDDGQRPTRRASPESAPPARPASGPRPTRPFPAPAARDGRPRTPPRRAPGSRAAADRRRSAASSSSACLRTRSTSAGIEVRVRDRVGQHIQAQLEERRRDLGVIDGLVEAGPRPQGPLDALDLAGAAARPAPLAAAQDQVLVEMRGAGQRRRIVRGARGHPDLDRDQRRDVVLLDHHANAVVEAVLGAHGRTPIAGGAPGTPSPPRPLARVVPQPATSGGAASARASATRAYVLRSHQTGGAYQKESGTGAPPSRLGCTLPEHETPGVLAGAGGRGRRPRVRARAGRRGARGDGTGSSIGCATRRSTSARA